MSVKSFNKTNFHKHTFCIFTEVGFDAIKDLKPNYYSNSGSRYYFTIAGVFRVSNHWGRAANCRWKLNSVLKKTTIDENKKLVRYKIGFAKWTDFYPNNEQENLFYIEVNFETKSIDFQHKYTANYTENLVCRNANETAKRIKICKEVLLETSWANHLNFTCIKKLRKEIINELCCTNKSFIEIKRNYINIRRIKIKNRNHLNIK